MSDCDSDDGIDYLPSDNPIPLPIPLPTTKQEDDAMELEDNNDLDDSIPESASGLAGAGAESDFQTTQEDELQSDVGLFVPLEAAPADAGPKPVDARETFVCEVCDHVVLSSRDTMRSHVFGRRHQQAVLETRERLVMAGYDLVNEPRVRQVPNPAPLRKKVPVRLQVKLLETDQPVVGLQCVDEFKPCYDSEMEPYYQCNLCGNIGEANGLFNHVTQSKHQKQFILAKFPKDPDLLDLDKEQMKRIALWYDEMPQLKRKVELIRTYESDLLFPWPQGKAPWAVEQGGDGTAPPFAREKVDANSSARELDHPTWRKLRENRARALEALACRLPDAEETLPPVTSDAEAEQYCYFLAEMARKLEVFAMKEDRPEEMRDEIRASTNALQAFALMAVDGLDEVAEEWPEDEKPSKAARRPAAF